MKHLVKFYLVLLMVGCTSTIQHELPGEKISTRKAADFNEKSDDYVEERKILKSLGYIQ